MRRRAWFRLKFCALAFVAGALAACAGNGQGAADGPGRFAEYAGREIEEVELIGDLQLPEDTLRAVLITRPTECNILFIPLCIGSFGRERHTLDLNALQRDLVRLQLVYRDFGRYGTRVFPAVDPVEGGGVRVRFAIDAGQVVTLRRLEVEGTEGIISPETLRDRLPLEVERPFGRDDFLQSAATIEAEMLQRGYAFSQVFRNYAIDTIADVAEARFEVAPGPLVTVDTIRIVGTHRIDPLTIRRQISFARGDVLRTSELNRSQRNLYDLGMVSFASVEIAPDSLQRDTAAARATVLVRVVEAAQYVVEATAGYGTADCFRTQLRRVDRNFLGNGRRLELSGSLSKIGAGWPLDAGLDGSLCRELREDRFSDTVNYRVAADFEQPRLFGTRTSAGVQLFAERNSEIDTFLREAIGGQLVFSRTPVPGTVISTGLDVQRGRTDADDVFFCFGLDTCSREAIGPLKRFRWSNALTVAAIRDARSFSGALTTGGYRARTAVDWATPAIASDDRFLRTVAEGAAYREVAPGWTLSARLLGGTFLQGRIGDIDEFVPAEQRFYAGGPNTVRGYGRNELGPTVYVADSVAIDSAGGLDTRCGDLERACRSAIGGTRTVLGSVELEFPSPLLRRYLRGAVFVDAGQVWAPGTEIPTSPIRATPGAGLRLATPIGPLRFDLAYRSARFAEGPLFVFDPDDPSGQLTLLRRRFRQGGDNSFLDRLQLQIGVGPVF
ncbi:outer membrane protein assembly factor BamA [soil metagenome]